VQGRGALCRELVRHLRTGRALRKPRRTEGERRGRIPGKVMIADRPAEAADRAHPTGAPAGRHRTAGNRPALYQLV
jgi:IS30 family transposase